MLKDRQFTILNIVGLSAGIACTLLIFLWVNDELSFDKFLANNDRLYQLVERSNTSDDISMSDGSSGQLSEAVAHEMPEVEYASPVAPPSWFHKFTLSVNDKNIKAGGQYAGKDYFNIFSFQLLDGNRNNVLANKNSIVISDELAQKLFGTANNIVGKPIRFEQDTTFYVSGVFKKAPYHSTQQFDFVLSWDYFKTIQDWVTSWDNIGPQNFVLLKKGADINVFNKKIAGIIAEHSGNEKRIAFATKFSDVYLHNNFSGNSKSGRIAYVKMFSLIALFILVIACINFMNLSTARASGRMKEVGIKKVIGAGRKQLIFQFLSESVLLTLLSTLLAVLIVELLLPAFNNITGKAITLHFNLQIIVALWGVILFTGLLAGSYPALYLSKFKPLAVLKGKLNTSFAEVISRKGLVVFQFALSSILIVAVVIIYQQIQFIQNTNPGFSKENVIRIDAEGKIEGNESTFITELKNISGVVNASYTFTNMIGHTYGDYGLSWPGKDPNEGIYFEVFGGGYDFMKTMSMHILEGRGFSREFASDTSNIILNEAAVKVMNLKNPVGKTVVLYKKPVQVIGVVQDFHFESLHQEVKPVYMLLQPHGGKIVARISAAHQKETIAAIQRLYENFNPGFPFTFNFLDEAYQRQYDTDTKVSVLSKYFAGLAILISCLGLFGLAAFTAQKRRKEIGIRKVVGASVKSIAFMLSKEFLRLVLIAVVIAFPVAWWAMNQWLQGFAYRIHINGAVFLLVAVFVIAITLFTVSFQSVKAALTNPVKSLRNE